MINKNHNKLRELQQILQFVADGFCDAIVIVTKMPPELFDEGFLSCKRWLAMMQRDLDKFEKEMREEI